MDYKEACPAFTMYKANRTIFQQRVTALRTPRNTKKLADPSRYSLKGDEWGDFIVTTMLYACEGLVNDAIFNILSLMRDIFILCTQLRTMRTATIREKLKAIGKAIEQVSLPAPFSSPPPPTVIFESPPFSSRRSIFRSPVSRSLFTGWLFTLPSQLRTPAP